MSDKKTTPPGKRSAAANLRKETKANSPVERSETKTAGFSKDKFIIYSMIIAFLGFLISSYLTILHYKNIIPPCTATHGCETVLTSKYSMVGPVPVALLGVIFFLIIMALSLLITTNYSKNLVKLFYFSAGVGLVVAVILVSIQGFVIHAFCQYCLTCEASATGIAILGFLDYKKRKIRI